MKSYLTLILISFLNLIFVSCSSSKIINLRTAKDTVKEYYESGKYEEELKNVFGKAKDQLRNVEIKQNSTAVFDVDDTALSNYEISKKLDFGYDYKIVQDWVMSAKLPAIKETKEFYDYLKSRGIRLIFITSRQYDEYASTLNNLVEQGYTGFDTLIVRNPIEKTLPNAEFKSEKRMDLTKAGYDILLSVGDQWPDLEGPYTGIKVKIPNYLYLTK